MTLRSRVLLGLGLIAVVFGVTAILVPRITASYLVGQVDDQLRVFDGGPVSARFESQLDEIPGSEIPGSPPAGSGGVIVGPAPDVLTERPSQIFFARIDADGAVADRVEPNFGEVSSPDLGDTARFVAEAGEGPFTVGGDTRYRFVANAEDDGSVMVVGIPLNDVDDTVSRLVRMELVALATVLGTLALVAWWVVRLGVRPVKEMAAAATDIGAGDLSARVPQYDEATEAGQLGVALNQMLGRIEDEFDQRLRTEQRLRQFAADASHELRTPVTTVRGYAELYRSGALDDPTELAEAMRRVEQETVRMGGLVDDLLRLARLDQGRELERSPVDLAAGVADAARVAQATDPGRPFTVEADEPVVVQGDERLLRQLVSNLTANALVHTDPDVRVRLRAFTEGGGGGETGRRAVVEVADEGPGMADDVAERVFERFYRADPSRSRHRGGSGLGLAIVEATVTAHGGTVTVTTAPGEGTTFRAVLPLS
jgi:two-component system OmpR family sensor kinase